jgi:hypothetical protein
MYIMKMLSTRNYKKILEFRNIQAGFQNFFESIYYLLMSKSKKGLINKDIHLIMVDTVFVEKIRIKDNFQSINPTFSICEFFQIFLFYL